MIGTQRVSEDDNPDGTNTSPRIIIEEECTDDSEFLVAVDKLVAETETLLNSYEKLQDELFDLKHSKKCLSSRTKLKEKSAGTVSEFSEVVIGCGCQKGGNDSDDSFETVKII